LSLESAFTLRKKNAIRHLFHYATMALLPELPLMAKSGLKREPMPPLRFNLPQPVKKEVRLLAELNID